jgi:hypothetical protein
MATNGGGLPENPEARDAKDFGPGGSGGPAANPKKMRQNPPAAKRPAGPAKEPRAKLGVDGRQNRP